ncbi:MAG: hypothetical protein C0598_12860 [Marinilabiliales bacterium]|nr:MAG: hypothetical protein C0598_12860 [Marinilabiliales bacterium]
MKTYRKLTLPFLFLIIFIPNVINAQSIDWVRNSGGESSDQAYCISSDNDGNVYMSGWFSGNAYFGDFVLSSEGGKDIFIAKYNSSGEILWVKKAWGAGDDVTAGITTDWDGFPIITGWFQEALHFGDFVVESNGSYDMFVARYNAEGDVIWAKSAGGEGDDYGNRLTTNAEHDVLVAGSFRYTANFGDDNAIISEGNRDIFIANYSNSGNLHWVKKAGGVGEDRAYSIVSDENNGDIYFTGMFNGKANFGDNFIECTSIVGSFVARMDAAGNFLWAKKGIGGANDYARGFGIGLDAESHIYSNGTYSGKLIYADNVVESSGGQFDFDTYTLKMNQSGEVLWLKTGGGYGMDQGRDLFTKSNGLTFTTGFFSGNAAFGDITLESTGKADVFIVAYNSAGAIEFAEKSGGNFLDYGYGICDGASEPSSLYFCGNFQEQAAFGDYSIEGWGGMDMFVSKLTYGNSSVNENDKSNISINPNPSNGIFKISLNRLSPTSRINIYTVDGKLVYTKTISDLETDLSLDLIPGTYNLQLLPENQNHKIIVK